MESTPDKQQLLRRSANLMGKKKLAERMRIPEKLLEAWIRGEATMPDGKLLRLTQILVELAGPVR